MFSTKRCISASLLNSLFHFFLLLFVFVLFCFCCFLLVKNVLHFFSELKLCQLVISIMREKI